MRYDGYMKILSRLMEMMREEHKNFMQDLSDEYYMGRFEALMVAYSLVEEVMNEDAEAED